MSIHRFYGMEIRVSPDLPKKPKLKLSESAPVTDKFRLEFNMWLANLFGEKSQAIRVGNVTFVSPETYRELQKEHQYPKLYQQSGFK